MVDVFTTGGDGWSLVLYDSVLFNRGHMVARWAEALQHRYTTNARLRAPVGARINKSDWYPEHDYAGALAASIDGFAEKVGPKHWQMIIEFGAPYTIYVLQGTDTIFPSSGKRLRLPYNAGFTNERTASDAGRYSLHPSVSGQEAQSGWLEQAHDATAVRHPSIRGGRNMMFDQW